MSASGRATDFMRSWGDGHNKSHDPGHKQWGADECDACTAETFGPWEALVHAAEMAGFIEQKGVGS